MKGFKDGRNTLIKKKKHNNWYPYCNSLVQQLSNLKCLVVKHVILIFWHLIRTSFLSGVHAWMQLTSPGSRNWDKGGGGAVSKKFFWSKNKGGEAGLPGPSRGSATANSNKCYLLMLLYALPPIHSGGSGPADQLFLSLRAEHTLRDVLQYRQTVENLKYHRIK